MAADHAAQWRRLEVSFANPQVRIGVRAALALHLEQLDERSVMADAQTEEYRRVALEGPPGVGLPMAAESAAAE